METQADRVVTIGELPLILKEEPAVRRTIIRILRDRFAERDITEDRFEHFFRELKEGREESRKKWEEQSRKWDKKWDKKWEEQDKKWERTEHRLDRLEKINRIL